jgi:hypothetical protein
VQRLVPDRVREHAQCCQRGGAKFLQCQLSVGIAIRRVTRLTPDDSSPSRRAIECRTPSRIDSACACRSWSVAVDELAVSRIEPRVVMTFVRCAGLGSERARRRRVRICCQLTAH